MHVLLITTSYPDARSGSEAAGGFVADFATELAKHVRVTVVAATHADDSTGVEEGVNCRRFAVRRWPLSLLNPLRPADWGAIRSTLADGLRTVRRVVDEDRPDYILALWVLPSGHWARLVQRDHGIPFGAWALGSDIWGLGRVPVVRSYLRFVLRKANDRFADGLRLAQSVESLSERPCGFLPSARLLPDVAPESVAETGPYKLAYLGRWHPNKGVDLFLESLLRLDDEDWSSVAEVRIHGGGPLDAEVRRMAGELQARGRPVRVGGYIDAGAATDLISWADYLVLPSRVESIPVVFSDAAQLGRPLIATPVGDLPDLFARHEFGVLAESVSVDAFVKALQRGLRASATDFRQHVSAVAESFDISVVASRFAADLKERIR